MILVDASSIFVSSIMAQIKTFDEQPELVRHTIFNIIRRFNLEHREEYGEMVLCFDSKNNWRKDAFPQYKANRKKNRDSSDHDWKAIFDFINKTTEEIKEYSPFRCVEVDRCEADDIIGTLCEKHMNPEPILIVSPDKDFVQLQRYPNVRQYSNIQKKWVEPEVDAMTDLANKVLSGDTGDGVPNVLSDDNVLVESRRQTVLSKKKRETLLENPEGLGTTVARQIIRNRDMIDLTRTPADLKEQILEAFEQKPKGSIMRLMTLFTKNQMKLMIESLGDFEVRYLNK